MSSTPSPSLDPRSRRRSVPGASLRGVLAFAALACCASVASAEEGTVSGRVVDADGAAVAAARVLLADTVGEERGEVVTRTETAADGTFSLEAAPGTWTVWIERSGFVPTAREIEVRPDRPLELEVTLEAGSFDEAMTVTAPAYVATRSTVGTKTDTPLLETPQAVSVITAAQLDERDVTTLGQALRYTPGAQGEPFGFEPRFTLLKLRGFSAFTTGFYRDGLQLRNPGFAVGYDIEPYSAEEIAVLRGPASVLYGAASPGGLLNVVTKRPRLQPIREVEVELGRFDRFEGKFDVSGRIDDDGVTSYRLTGLARESDTQVDFVPTDRLFFAPGFTWRPSRDTELTILAHYQDDETLSSQALPGAGTLEPNPVGEIPVGLFTGEPEVDTYDREESSLSYFFRHRFGDVWTFRQNARYYTIDLDDVTVFSAFLRADQRTLDRSVFGSFGELDGFALDNQAEATFGHGSVRHTLLLGLDYQHVDVSSFQTFGAAPPLDLFDPVYGAAVPDPSPIQDAETAQEQIGLYVQDQIEIGEKWVVQLGGRYDQADEETEESLFGGTTEQDDDEFTGRAGIVYKSDAGLAPYVSFSQSFLPVVGTDPEGRAFEPETGEQVEVGLKYQPPGGSSFLTVALFDLVRENVVQFDPATFLQVQTGEIESRGLEVEAVASLDLGLDLIATYTHLDMEITESNVAAEIGSTPTQVPEDMASLWAEYTIQGGALEGLALGAGLRYLGSTWGDVPNTVEVPSQALADAMVRYGWGGLRLSLIAKNVFDEEYVASCFVRGGTFCTFGPTRRVTASLAYRW